MFEKADQEIDNEVDTIEVETDADADESNETNAVADTDGESEEAEDDSEVVVSIGEDSPPQEEETRAPEWVRELRKANREKEKRIKELEAKLNATTETKPVTLAKKPTLEDCDYDSEEFEKRLEDWYEDKRQYDAMQAEANAKQEADAKDWQNRLDAYEKAKSSLKVRDYEDAEAFALDTFSITQQGILIQGSDNPALIVYALGKNAKRAKELASIDDPVRFAFAVAKLETQLKVTNRKATVAPEKTIASGGSSISGSMDSTLERLRAEAEKTGNYSKVIQYKKQKRQA